MGNKVSIIIPVYNVEKYLKKCISSVQNQIYKNLEIILVDDGSKDNSATICDDFAKRDNRVKVIHKANGGVSSARNAGLDVACGEYVMFVDADDWISEDLCEKILSQNNDADLVIGGYTVMNKNGKQKYLLANKEMNFPKDFGIEFDELFKNNYINAPFSKVYKSHLINGQRFDTTIALGEDFLFNLKYISKCKRIATVNTSGYFYNCLNENAATKKFRDSDVQQIYYLYLQGKQFLHEFCPQKENSLEIKKRFCLNGINIIQLICYSNKSSFEKKKLAMKLLCNDDFVEVCREKYSLPFKYDLPRKLSCKKSWYGLQVFFGFKKKIGCMRGR